MWHESMAMKIADPAYDRSSSLFASSTGWDDTGLRCAVSQGWPASRLQGMFSFAVWDRRRQVLVLGRDPMGKKPLYYWQQAGRLVFGSEIKAVSANPLVPRDLDEEAIPAYLTFGYVPTPRTFFAG